MSWSDVLYVAYAADNNYAQYLGVSLLSLLEQNKEFKRIKVFVLDSQIASTNKEELRKIVQSFQREIVFMPVAQLLASLDLNMKNYHIAEAAYARLFLASLLPKQVERVLYLDCDTLIVDSLQSCWAVDLADNLVAGVQDTVDKFFRDIINLNIQMPYLNSGVLILNLQLWRAQKLEQDFEAFIERFQGDVPHHDQGIVNGVVGERRVLLPLRFNLTSNIYAFTVQTISRMYALDDYYSEEERKEALEKPAIIHFTPGVYGRPWEENCRHPAKDIYLQVLSRSPWRTMDLKPDSLKKSVKIFAFLYNVLPLRMFEIGYRFLVWLLYLGRK